MAQTPNEHSADHSIGSWVLTIIMLFVFWPVGLLLLINKLLHLSPRPVGRRSIIDTTAVPVEPRRPDAAPKTASESVRQAAFPTDRLGWALSGAGVLLLVIAGKSLIGQIGDVFSFGYSGYMLTDFLLATGGVATGAVLLLFGAARRAQLRRFRKYLMLIGTQKELAIDALAKAMPVSFRRACRDLQDMIGFGLLPAGYVDSGRARLVFSDAGLRQEEPPVKPEQKSALTGSEAVLAEIREINDAIPDEAMSRKIDRIGEITAKIFDFQRKNPGSAGELRSFLDYYLPTTLKILRSYAQLDAQGVSGENIASAKARIEGMMDQVVEGFENRLDQLFRGDALDITSDVAVMEQMMARDGLTHIDEIKLS